MSDRRGHWWVLLGLGVVCPTFALLAVAGFVATLSASPESVAGIVLSGAVGVAAVIVSARRLRRAG